MSNLEIIVRFLFILIALGIIGIFFFTLYAVITAALFIHKHKFKVHMNGFQIVLSTKE